MDDYKEFKACKYDYIPIEDNVGGYLLRRNLKNEPRCTGPVPGVFKIWKPNNNIEFDVEFEHHDGHGNNDSAERNMIDQRRRLKLFKFYPTNKKPQKNYYLYKVTTVNVEGEQIRNINYYGIHWKDDQDVEILKKITMNDIRNLFPNNDAEIPVDEIVDQLHATHINTAQPNDTQHDTAP